MTHSDPSYHYRVMERAIALIDAPGGAQLSLGALAAKMGMSAAHFQRLFSEWVGVSPKRYQQYLTLGHARTLLDENYTTFDTALNLGLSGQSRLHDLFLRWEAMTPGEYARKGQGLDISYGWCASPFGLVLGMATHRGLCGLAFADDPDACLADMQRRWPKARYTENTSALRPLIDAAFAQSGELRLNMIGTPFQIKVWEALLKIPEGHVTTYGEIGKHIGAPSAARAVGSAVGRNPLGVIIPCHRCLRGAGGLGGYHWGVARKRAILGWESARHEARCENGALMRT